MLRSSWKALTGGEDHESAAQIFSHYTARELDLTQRKSQRATDIEAAAMRARMQGTSPDPTRGSHYAWAKGKFAGGIETVNRRHRPQSNQVAERSSMKLEEQSAAGAMGAEPDIAKVASMASASAVPKGAAKDLMMDDSDTKSVKSTASTMPRFAAKLFKHADKTNSPAQARPKSASDLSDNSENFTTTKSGLRLPKKISGLKSKYMSAIHAKSERNFKKALQASLKMKKSKKEDTVGDDSSHKTSVKGIGKADFAFKQAMLQKYQALGPQMNGGNNTSYGAMQYQRKDSSFNAENSKILLIGPAKSGKSTLFKELCTMSGMPPNYARAYVPTREPIEKDVTLNNETFTLVDVGGDKENVVKWRYYLGNSDLIIFVVSLDDFDRMDKSTNKNCLIESLELFDSIINNVAVLSSKIVLLLNKVDRLKKKLSEKGVKINVTGAFPDAPDTTDFEEGLAYIRGLFEKKINESSAEHMIEIEALSATDSSTSLEVLERLTEDMVRSQGVNKWKNLL